MSLLETSSSEHKLIEHRHSIQCHNKTSIAFFSCFAGTIEMKWNNR